LAERPADPDLIFVEEAEQLTRCCRQTLATIAQKEELECVSRQVLDRIGKAHWRTFYRKSELLGLFFKRPPAGEPIRSPDGALYFLRDNAKQRFSFSDIVLSYWTRQGSKLHAGKALRTRMVYIIQGCRQGPPKRVTAWRGEDLEAIQAAREGEYPERGKTSAARRQRHAAREEALEALRSLKPNLPLPAVEAIARVMAQGVSRFLAYDLRKKAGIGTRRREDGVYFWCRPGQQLPGTVPAAPVAPEVQTPPPDPPAPKNRPGRPLGSVGARAQQRRDQVIRAWQERQYATVADLARAFRMNRTTASKILKGAGLRA
jgi:hypothetical protein